VRGKQHIQLWIANRLHALKLRLLLIKRPTIDELDRKHILPHAITALLLCPKIKDKVEFYESLSSIRCC
jgi:hypothetical protein